MQGNAVQQEAAFQALRNEAVGQPTGFAKRQKESHQLATEIGRGHDDEALPLIPLLNNKSESSSFKLLPLCTPLPTPTRLALSESPRHTSANNRPAAPHKVVYLGYEAKNDEKLGLPKLEDSESKAIGSVPRVNIKKRKQPAPPPF